MVLQLEDKHRKRVEALREVCKGEGLSREDGRGEEALLETLGEGYDRKDFVGVMGLLDDLLPSDNVYIDAFTNAVWGRDGLNLTQRREDFLTKNGSISARTLMRYEQEGIELFVKCLELAEDQFERRRELEEDEDTARDIDIQVLRERVTKLERLVEPKPSDDASHDVPLDDDRVTDIQEELRALNSRLNDLEYNFAQVEIMSLISYKRLHLLIWQLFEKQGFELDQKDGDNRIAVDLNDKALQLPGWIDDRIQEILSKPST